MEYLEGFARKGLRTLMYCKKQLSLKSYQAWRVVYDAANSTLGSDRKARLETAFKRIEQGLEVQGCSGIQDDLQESVPESIEFLRKAGVKLWILIPT